MVLMSIHNPETARLEDVIYLWNAGNVELREQEEERAHLRTSSS